jgi:hypothetical protein
VWPQTLDQFLNLDQHSMIAQAVVAVNEYPALLAEMIAQGEER